MGVAVYLDPGIARSPENGLVLGGSGRFWAVLGGSGGSEGGSRIVLEVKIFALGLYLRSRFSL